MFGMVDGVNSPEDNTVHRAKGQWCATSPGSESTACIQSKQVNVGGPERSAMEGSIGKQARRVRMLRRCEGSQMGHSTDEAR
jgi:hypothetical protein